MEITIGQTATMDFTTHNPVTGMVQDADFLPTCQVFQDTIDVPLATPVVTKRVGQVGDYRVTFVASAANGFVAGRSYNVIADATVAAITAKATVDSFILNAPAGAVFQV